MVSDPSQRLTLTDLQHDDYVIEIMHIIDSSQVKYPASRDTKWDRNGMFFHSQLISLVENQFFQ